MIDFKVYDAGTDEMVPLTQERLDQLTHIATMFGIQRAVMRKMLEAPMVGNKPSESYRKMMWALANVASAE